MEDMAEALQIIKDWNHTIHPSFLCQIILKVIDQLWEKYFLAKVYLCYFEGTVVGAVGKNDDNEVSTADQAELLELLHSCVWASPLDSSSDLQFDANYQELLKIL